MTKRIIFIISGLLSLGLGILGIFLPLLPTTPFLLLSAYLFMRSSKKLYDWLMNHRYLGPYLQNFIVHKTIPRRSRIISILLLWITITGSAILIDNWYIRGGLFVVAVAVTLHINQYKTKRS